MEPINLYRRKVTGPIERHVTTYKTDHSHPVTPYDPDDFLVEEYYKLTEGFNTPNYRLRLAKGELIPYTVFRQVEITGRLAVAPFSWTGPSSTWTIRNPGHSTSKAIATTRWKITERELTSTLNFGPSQYSLQAAASKIYSDGWDALTFGAELGKTVLMFRNLIKSLTNFLMGLPNTPFELDRLVKGRLVSVDQMKNVPFSKWLELRYGWRTLLYDMQDFCDYVVDVNDLRKRWNERVGKTDKATVESNHSYTHTPGTVFLKTIDEKSASYRGSIVADVDPPKLQFNPITTAWELITLSFVIDWFLNIGQWLESLSFLAVERQYVGAVGFEYKLKRTMITTNVVPTVGYSYSWSPSTVYEGTFTARDPSSVSLLPQLAVRLDTFKVLDLVALAIQRFLRR